MREEPEPNAAASPGVYRRAASNPRQVRELVFDRLPPAVRDHLTHGIVHGAPEPLLAAPSGRAPLVMRALLGVTVLAAGAVPVVAVWGDGYNVFQSPGYAGVYAVLLAVVAVAGAGVVRLRTFLRGAPFRSGRYLFALDLVETSGGRVRVTSLDTLRTAEARPGAVAAIFEDGHEVVFPTERSRWRRAEGSATSAETVARRVNRALSSARALAHPGDLAKLALLDPFFEVRVSEDWDTAADRGDRGRSRFVLGALVALAAAAPAGYGALSARNALKDELMFEDARGRDISGHMSANKLETYVIHGRRHQDEAARLLVDQEGDNLSALRRYVAGGGALGAAADGALFDQVKHDPVDLGLYLRRGGPRSAEADEALFTIARRMDTVASYGTYLESGKLHAEEVKRDLLPDADFKQAVRTGLVGSLFSFVRRNPGSKHEDEAWQLIRKPYAQALPAFEDVQKPPPAGRAFVEALLAALQDRADPRVTLDVAINAPESVVRADALLGARYGDRYLPGAERFSAESLQDVAGGVRESVGIWFAGAFRHGVAETARPSSEDEGRPRIEIRLTPTAYGSAEWRIPGEESGQPSHVTPLVGFLVEVRGVVTTREGKEATVTWKTSLADTTDGKMAAVTFNGQPRAQGAMLDDAFARFLESVPSNVASTFNDRL